VVVPVHRRLARQVVAIAGRQGGLDVDLQRLDARQDAEALIEAAAAAGWPGSWYRAGHVEQVQVVGQLEHRPVEGPGVAGRVRPLDRGRRILRVRPPAVERRGIPGTDQLGAPASATPNDCC